MKFAIICALAFGAGAGSLYGQKGPDSRPYDKDLLRLSEILGSIHYLNALCGTKYEMSWRKGMEDLLEAEGKLAKRRLLFTRSFNKGYNAFGLTYRQCTPSALQVIENYKKEGGEIAARLITHHQR